jgi:hypothetical protein
MAINTGVNVSKLVGYAVLASPQAVNVTKLNAYAVLVSVAIPEWSSFIFGNGLVGTAYTYPFTFRYEAQPVTTTLLSGSLPPGLALTSTSSGGTLAGTPTLFGTYTFTLRATNPYGTADKSFTIVITNVVPGTNSGWIK